MKYLLLCTFTLFSYFLTRAQFDQVDEGQYSGENITQADLDILFVNNPNLYWLNFNYTDTFLLLPDFKKLNILAIRSEALHTIVFPDTLMELGLIDFNLPSLTTLREPIAPSLFELSLHANLTNIPKLICACEDLTIIDFKNYQVLELPECLKERFANGNFEYSSCEIIDGIGGETVAKIISTDSAPDEWLESSDDMTDEELRDLQKGMQRTGRMITVIRRASGLALAGILFLILKS